MNEAMNTAPQQPDRSSFAVGPIREEYGSGEVLNAEDHARKLADHIRAIDEELEALSEERGRLAKECIQAADEMSESREKYLAVARNEYRDPASGKGF